MIEKSLLVRFLINWSSILPTGQLPLVLAHKVLLQLKTEAVAGYRNHSWKLVSSYREILCWVKIGSDVSVFTPRQGYVGKGHFY